MMVYAVMGSSPSIGSTMERVVVVVLIGENMIGCSIDLKGRVLDAVGIATRDTAQVRMLPVNTIVAGIIETEDDITLYSVSVVDEEV